MNQKWNQKKIYRVETLNKYGQWVEICPRQPTIEAAAKKRFNYAWRNKVELDSIRVVEQDP